MRSRNVESKSAYCKKLYIRMKHTSSWKRLCKESEQASRFCFSDFAFWNSINNVDSRLSISFAFGIITFNFQLHVWNHCVQPESAPHFQFSLQFNDSSLLLQSQQQHLLKSTMRNRNLITESSSTWWSQKKESLPVLTRLARISTNSIRFFWNSCSCDAWIAYS